jgi:hypothetical protein
VADGNVHLAEFEWDHGRNATAGSFAGVPLASAARFAGKPLPFDSTVKLGGDWSLAAAPRLTGALKIRRESGDVLLARSAGSAERIAAASPRRGDRGVRRRRRRRHGGVPFDAGRRRRRRLAIGA